MRTLLISEFFPPRVGGTPTWFYEVYRRYPAGEAMVLTDYQPGDEAVDPRLALPIRRVPMRMEDWGFLRLGSLRQYLRLTLTAWRLARAQHVHMIHCGRVMTEGVIGYVLWQFARVPYCVYAHGEEIGTALSSRQLTFLMYRAYGAAQKIIANSEHTRGLLRAIGVPDTKIVVIHPGVDSVHFHFCDDDAHARERLRLDGHRVLLSVGRLQRRKGHDMVIKALPAIAAAIPDVKYVIVGTGEEEGRLRGLAEEMGVAHLVEFAGRVTDERLPAYYQACNVFLMPNREEGHQDIEGFGIVFLEANACGKPVIGGRSGGTGEAIVDGESGVRVDGENPDAIADAAIALLQNRERAEEMGRRGRARVVERFDWDTIAARTRQLK
jgi:phosphatidylinositol alpha-1,6-mannosyltransferase